MSSAPGEPAARVSRVPWGTLAPGLVLAVAGVVAAWLLLPEWQPPPLTKARALGIVRGELAAMGATFERPRADLRNSVDTTEYERAYRRLGTRAPELLATLSGIASWTVTGEMKVPGVGKGPVEVVVGRDGRLRRVEFGFGSPFQVGGLAPDVERATEAFATRLLDRMAAGQTRAAEPEVTQRGNVLVKAFLLSEEPGRPREVLVRILPGNPFVMVNRELADPDAGERFRSRALRGLAVVVPLFGALALLVLVLLGVLLFRRRLSFRVALALGALALGSMVVSGSLFGAAGSAGTMTAYLVAGKLVLAVSLVALWAVAESLLRDTVPGFATSLDALVAGRLGPRLGRALLGGLGLGAAIAGYRLLFSALAARLGLPGVYPEGASFYLPLFGGFANPFVEGPSAAGLMTLFMAMLRFVVRKERADPLGAAAYALFYSSAGLFSPWGTTLVYFLAEACVLLLAFRRFGLTALLVAATAAPLVRDVAVGVRYPGELAVPLLLGSAALAALAALGVAACRRSEREDEARVDAPEYVKRLEAERRVKVEMDLLARMQLALLPDHPPEVPGLSIAARTVLATEAGGDLYEFLVDDEGSLWVAVGDVSGHGYSCGIQGAMVKACLLSLVTAARRPAEVLREIDRVLRSGKSRLFTSLTLLRLDPKTGHVVVANAGHPFPLLLVEGKCREIELPGLPLGQGPRRVYADHELVLAGGATLVLASDGLFEGPDRFGEPYGYDKPREVLERIGLWRRPADSILEALVADWRGHVGDGAPADDTTVVVVRRALYA